MTPEEGAGSLVPVAGNGRDGGRGTGDALACAGPVVLFDGVCNLCNGAVQFVLDHERAPVLRFAALQSEFARALLASVGPIAELGDGATTSDAAGERSRADGASEASEPSTIVFVEGGRAYVRSTAALRVARYLRAPWRFLFGLIVVPRFLREAVYRWVARNRYRWFGKTEACRVPTPELRARFLE